MKKKSFSYLKKINRLSDFYKKIDDVELFSDANANSINITKLRVKHKRVDLDR